MLMLTRLVLYKNYYLLITILFYKCTFLFMMLFWDEEMPLMARKLYNFSRGASAPLMATYSFSNGTSEGTPVIWFETMLNYLHHLQGRLGSEWSVPGHEPVPLRQKSSTPFNF